MDWDHLRALAAGLVFCWHALHRTVSTTSTANHWLGSLFEEGWVGVELFIVITGFVFTVITFGKEIDYFAFLKNRLLRLLPLIFLVTLFATYATGAPRDSILQFFLLLGAGTVYGTWTLVIEFQFYLTFPFLRDRLIREYWHLTAISCGCLLAVFVFLRLSYFVQKGEVQDMAYYSILGKMDEFVAGIPAGLAYVHWRGRSPNPWVLLLSLIVGSAAVVAAIHWFDVTGGFYDRPKTPRDGSIWLIWPTIMGVCWATIVGSYCLLTQRWSGWIARSVAYLGAISYSTYMLHFLTLPVSGYLYESYVWWMGYQFTDTPIWNATLAIVLFHYPLAITVSAVSYELIEKAFLMRRVPYLTPRSPAAIP